MSELRRAVGNRAAYRYKVSNRPHEPFGFEYEGHNFEVHVDTSKSKVKLRVYRILDNLELEDWITVLP